MDKKRFIVIMIFIIIFTISIVFSALYYNNKYSVSFETGTEDVILTQYVEKNEKVKEPTKLSKEGYVFKEWQLDGETYNFNSLVKEDIVLTAKWVKEEYIKVNFKTNSYLLIEPIKIIKGESINELPDSIKEDYEFIGWYLNDKLYNNEEIYDDVTLVAEYKNETFNTTYKIGDTIKIVDKYSNSAYSNSADYSVAIGWERKILNIMEDTNYPYVIGDETGITGFFKANSIERGV